MHLFLMVVKLLCFNVDVYFVLVLSHFRYDALDFDSNFSSTCKFWIRHLFSRFGLYISHGVLLPTSCSHAFD